MMRSDRQTTEAAAWAAVDSSPYGVLSMTDPQGEPYGVALNLWRMDRDLYFHTALTGRKTDCLRQNPRVSLCFVSRADIAPAALTMHFTSAVLTGVAEEVTDSEEKRAALLALCRRYGVDEAHPAMKNGFTACLPETAIWRIRVDSITGKAHG